MAQLNNLIVTGSSRFLNKVYFSNGGTFNGNLNVNNGNININNGNLQLYGKVALQGFDNWLRINDGGNNNPFAYGIYCGNGTLRTDGEFQVGDGEHCFIANSSAITCNRSLIVNAGVDFEYGATIRNAGLELYFSTPFIDFHFNNSNKDFTSRIIESKENVLSINGVTCSSSNLAANNVSATNVNVSSRINADAATAIFNNVYVKDELRSTTWAIDNITNLGSTFYVSPCIIFTNPSVYINSKSGTTVTLTITDNNIISSTIGGQTWTSGSKIKLMGRINTSVLGVANGTMARQLNTTTAKTAYITLNFATTDDCAGIEQGKTYSGSAIGDLKMMMYEVNLNVNGTTKNRPVGIRMSSYNEDKKSSIDIYDGTVDDGKPIVRMGYLNGLPSVNGENPTGYGFYAVGNAFFSGRIVSGSGKIGGFSLSENSIQNGSFGQSGGVLICTGTNSSASIGGSNSINGWCFTASNTFGVTKTGALYASNAHITGSITATSGKIGGFSLSENSIQNGSFGQSGGVLICTGTNSSASIGGSNSINGWCFTASNTFGVTKTGALYASNAHITGSINASSLTAKQYYKIYDSNGKNERTFVSWSGDTLSFGLVSQNQVPEAYIQMSPGSTTVEFSGDIGATQGTIYADLIDAGGSLSVKGTSTFKGATTFNSTLTCKSTSTFSGTSTFTGALKAGSFTFRDYSETDNNNIVYRRPVASAGSDKARVAILQGTSNNKIVIKAQYNSTNFTNATFTASSSDIRLKEDIKDSSVNALSKIMQMQIREFNWKQTGMHQELGCVADELELIDPLLTTGGGYDEDGTMNIKSIDTLLLSEYAIKGIQELYKQYKKQQKRIEYLESQLNNR